VITFIFVIIIIIIIIDIDIDIVPMLSGTMLDGWLNSSTGKKRIGLKEAACTLPPDLICGPGFANH
jgi:hypothetical protein